jgi:hypothetical protein
MEFSLTTHALRRTIVRDITEETLVAALEQPRSISAVRTPGTLVYDAVVEGGGIRVVVVEGTSPLRIVAVMVRRVRRAR